MCYMYFILFFEFFFVFYVIFEASYSSQDRVIGTEKILFIVYSVEKLLNCDYLKCNVKL